MAIIFIEVTSNVIQIWSYNTFAPLKKRQWKIKKTLTDTDGILICKPENLVGHIVASSTRPQPAETTTTLKKHPIYGDYYEGKWYPVTVKGTNYTHKIMYLDNKYLIRAAQ